MDTVLCLDFDGVLCDSMDECLVTGFNAYYGVQISSAQEVPFGLRDFYCRYRYLVAPADDFYLLFHAFDRGMETLERETFEQLKKSTLDARREFSRHFFAARELLKKDIEHWLGLHRMYSQCRAVLDDDFPRFHIVTTKDSDSVERLATRHGYRSKVLSIYGKEISTDKRISLQKLLVDWQIDVCRKPVIFVDDNREHLEQVKSVVTRHYLAGWGYTGPIETDAFTVLGELSELGLQIKKDRQ